MTSTEDLTLVDFANIGAHMLWKEAALHQLRDFSALSKRLNKPAIVVGSHTSKSIPLPVVKFTIDGYRFFLRDNFYGVNLCVLAPSPIDVPIAELFSGIIEPKDWNWYLGEIARCRGYSWKYFSDEEMDDPRILRVFRPPEHSYDGAPREWDCDKAEKDRWLKRMTDPEWYYKDWSHSKLSWDGEFGPGVQIFFQGHAFLEGISALPEVFKERGWNQPYERGCKAFALDVGNFENAEKLIRKLVRIEAP